MIADSGRFSKSYPCRRTTERYLKGRHLGFNKHMLSVFVLACAVWFLFWRTFLLCRFRIRKFTCFIVFYLLFNASEFALTNTSVRFHYSVNTDIVSNNRRKSRMCMISRFKWNIKPNSQLWIWNNSTLPASSVLCSDLFLNQRDLIKPF